MPAFCGCLADSVFNSNRERRDVILLSNNLEVNKNSKPEIYTYNAKARINTTLLQIINVDTIDFEVQAQAISGSGQNTEIVLAMDVTNSMHTFNNFIPARNVILDTLEILKGGSQHFYVSLLPIDDRINIGTTRAAWLSSPAPIGWNGCVAPRHEIIGANYYALTDKSPLNIPFDVVDTPLSGGTEYSCSNEIQGPTQDYDTIVDYLNNSLQGARTGRFDIAMAWAWRLLSPNWQGEWGVPAYPAEYSEDMRKVVVFLTDGVANIQAMELSSGPNTTSLGYDKWTVEGFNNLVSVCNAMNSLGIEIFILNVNPNSHYDEYAKQCASSPEHYFISETLDDFKKAFPRILRGEGVQARLIK
jgi:hypothetical protein